MNKNKYYTYQGTLYKLLSISNLNSSALMLGLNRNTLKTYSLDFIDANFEQLTNYDPDLMDLLYKKEPFVEIMSHIRASLEESLKCTIGQNTKN